MAEEGRRPALSPTDATGWGPVDRAMQGRKAATPQNDIDPVKWNSQGQEPGYETTQTYRDVN